MKRTCVAIVTALAALLFAVAPAHAEPKVERRVNCVYPGETLGAALGDFAAQLGYAFEPGDFAEGIEIDEMIWVHARDIDAQGAAEIIGASGGLRVVVDDANRRVTLAEADDATPGAARVRAFDVKALCRMVTDYQKTYGMPVPTEPVELYRPIASGEIRDAVAEILQFESAPGSAIGQRIVYTRGNDDLDRIAELLRLLEAGGESESLALTRTQRADLSKLKAGLEQHDGQGLLSAALWLLFKDYTGPVFIERSLMDSLDLQYDQAGTNLRNCGDHYEALLAIARAHDFMVDSKFGALRLHEDVFAGAFGYCVYDMNALLATLAKEYEALKTQGTGEGFEGDLRSEGGIHVIADALGTQLEAAGHSPLIRCVGSKLVVVGGADVQEQAVEILKAIGWEEKK